MKFWLVIILATIALPVAFAEKGTFVDQIQFIQYLDENTALEEVRNGNLDMYYFRISCEASSIGTPFLIAKIAVFSLSSIKNHNIDFLLTPNEP